MTIEGVLEGKFVRVHFRNGMPDMHPEVRGAADLALAVLPEGYGLVPYPGGPEIMEGFYTSEEGFLALMVHTLDEVTGVEGYTPPEVAAGFPLGDAFFS